MDPKPTDHGGITVSEIAIPEFCMGNSMARTLLPWFVGVSLGIHLGLGYLITENTPKSIALSVTESAPTIISIALNSENPKTTPAHKKRNSMHSPRTNGPSQSVFTPKQIELPAEQAKLATAEKPVLINHEPPQEITTPARPEAAIREQFQTREEIRSRIQDAIQLRITEHFHYPPLARRRGLEGTVRVKITISPDVGITHTEIAHSSGHRILDQAAIRALSAVKREKINELNHLTEPMDLVLGIRYQLSFG